MTGWKHLPARALIFLIGLYRTYVSPLRLSTCRFMPTCSQYAVDALTEYGVVKGGWLAAARLTKCGPWHHGGWDPIPERDNAFGPHIRPHNVNDVGVASASRGESKSCV